MSQTPSQIVENIKTALPAIANAIKGNWDNIQSLNIKTNSSASLPIWSCTLDGSEGGRWNGLQAEAEEEEDLEVDGEESDADEVKPKKGPTSTGRKRSSSSDEEEEKPKKKAKTTDISSTTKPKILSVPKSSKLASAEVDSPIKKRKVTEQSLTPLKAPSAVEPSTPSSKKAQKAKSASTAATELSSSKSNSAPKSSTTSKSVEKEKKKSQSSAVPSKSSAPTIDAPLKKRKTADLPPSSKPVPSPTVADTITPSAGGDKARKERKKISKLPEAAPPPTAPEKGIKPSLTKGEFKQKRASGTGEKKKEKISKVKGGRSAKNALLGKKVSQV